MKVRSRRTRCTVSTLLPSPWGGQPHGSDSHEALEISEGRKTGRRGVRAITVTRLLTEQQLQATTFPK